MRDEVRDGHIEALMAALSIEDVKCRRRTKYLVGVESPRLPDMAMGVLCILRGPEPWFKFLGGDYIAPCEKLSTAVTKIIEEVRPSE